MRTVIPALVLCLANGCSANTFHTITSGQAEGPRVWFAEVEKQHGTSDKIAIIVCDAKAIPPCIRFSPLNVHKAGEVQAWAEQSRSERAAAQYAAPPPAHTEPPTK